MTTIKSLEAKLNSIPVTDQAAHRAIYLEISKLYVELRAGVR